MLLSGPGWRAAPRVRRLGDGKATGGEGRSVAGSGSRSGSERARDAADKRVLPATVSGTLGARGERDSSDSLALVSILDSFSDRHTRPSCCWGREVSLLARCCACAPAPLALLSSCSADETCFLAATLASPLSHTHTHTYTRHPRNLSRRPAAAAQGSSSSSVCECERESECLSACCARAAAAAAAAAATESTAAIDVRRRRTPSLNSPLTHTLSRRSSCCCGSSSRLGT